MDTFDLKRLTATTRGGARAREEEYGAFHAARGIKLRRKYRPPQLGQFGCGGDTSGKGAHRKKLSTKDKAKLKPQPEVVMLVGPSGRATRVRTGRVITAGHNWTEAWWPAGFIAEIRKNSESEANRREAA